MSELRANRNPTEGTKSIIFDPKLLQKNCRFETLMKEIKLIVIEKNEFENRDMSITEDL